MNNPMIVLPYWVSERIDISQLTTNSFSELFDKISDDELHWIINLHKLKQFTDIVTPIAFICDAERIRNVSVYQMSVVDVMSLCSRYMRLPHDFNVDNSNAYDIELHTNANMHVMLIKKPTSIRTKSSITQLAQQLSDNTSFSYMRKYNNGAIFNKYIYN